MKKQKSNSIEKLKEESVEFHNFRQITVSLYNSYRQRRRKIKNQRCMCLKKICRMVPGYLQIVWNELMPLPLWKNQSSQTISSLKELQKSSKIHLGSVETGFRLIEKTDSHFFILVYKELNLWEGDFIKIIQSIKQFCLVVSINDNYIRQKLQIKGGQGDYPILIACKRNIAEEVVVLAEVSVEGLGVDDFKLIHEGIRQQIQEYEMIESQIVKQCEREDKEKVESEVQE